MESYKIPKVYYNDHYYNNDIKPPTIIRETKSHYFIDVTEDDKMIEFRDRAALYASGDYWEDYRGLTLSARATLRVIGSVTNHPDGTQTTHHY